MANRSTTQAADLVLAPLRFAASHAASIAAAEPGAVTQLLDGLIQSGTAIALAGSSRPASGCEHHASHFWDLLAARGLREHGSHGLQVGYATRFAVGLQRFAFGADAAPLRVPTLPADPLGPSAREWLGEPTAEIVAAVAEKRRFIEGSAASWPPDEDSWAQRRAQLAPALELADLVARRARRARRPRRNPATWRSTSAPCARRFASRPGSEARYTTIDFLEGQGTLEPAIDAILG